MLKINPDPTFQADVEITVPGWKKPGSVTLTFKYRSRKEFVEFSTWANGATAEELQKMSITQWMKSRRPDDEVFPEFVVGWEGMDAEFNQENIATFLNNYPAAFQEIFRNYSSLLLESRIKN